MTGARLARLKRKIERWLYARQALLERTDAYRYIMCAEGVVDSATWRVLSDDEVLDVRGMDLWEERIA
jgi:hypothetical protein